MKYDIAIIGGGPAGYNAAAKAAKAGLSVIIFEKKAIGGICLNEGCIPTKTLLYSAKVLREIKNASKYGIFTDGKPHFELGKIMARKNKIVKKLTAGIKIKLKAGNVFIIEKEAFIEKIESESVHIRSEEELFTARYLLICTGSHPGIPPIKGLEENNYWTSSDALNIKELPSSLAIMGGGVIGIEFASFFTDLGVKVNVVEMMPEILGNMDQELSALLREEYTKLGVHFHLNANVTEIKSGRILIEKGGQTETIEAEKIIVSVGRKANLNGYGLENTRIDLNERGIKVNEYMQTNCPNVYACGDVTGFSLLAHTAIRESEVAVNHILGINDKMTYEAVPGVVYTNPEFAGVGKTEEELRDQDTFYQVLKLPMSYSGRFVVENELGTGLCKLIIDREGCIIGCHLLGNFASELITIASIAINKQFNVEEFKKQIFPHPSVGEIIHETLYGDFLS